MITRIVAAAALVCAFTMPAMADIGSCGTTPYPPVIPSVADIKSQAPADAATNRHQAFVDIQNWQASLKTYRTCLQATAAADKSKAASLDPKANSERIAALTAEMNDANKAYDETADTEEKVVNEFNAMRTAYCTRTDVDRSTCPK